MNEGPTAADRSIYEAVAGALEFLSGDAYSLVLNRAERSAMWFTEVRPTARGAAAFDVATAEDRIVFEVASTRFEFDLQNDGIREVELLAESVALGKFAEAGPSGRSFALFGTAEGEISAGAVHLPIPWGWRRRVRTFAPYSST